MDWKTMIAMLGFAAALVLILCSLSQCEMVGQQAEARQAEATARIEAAEKDAERRDLIQAGRAAR